MSESFAIGERVIIRSSAGMGASRYTFDRIVRDTTTRWITENHGWFDKQRLTGPRPKSDFTPADQLLRASDRTALQKMHTDTVRARASVVERTARLESVVDIGATRDAVRALLVALDHLEAVQ